MRPFLVKPAAYIKGKIVLSGDKSIAHRAVFIAAITPARTKIKNFSANEDCLSTINALRQLGVKIVCSPDKKSDSGEITVFGAGLFGLIGSKRPVFIGDSGTTFRLILGILAGQNFKTVLTAGKALSKRPMLRVTAPLRMMGAKIDARRLPIARQSATYNLQREEYPPITIRGARLKPINYKLLVASAQVKSAILLAGLYAKGLTQVSELMKTRDHTERMLKLFKANIKFKYNRISIRGGRRLVSPGAITIPGDISSASFFIVLASILPDSEILLKDVGLNPSRLGIISVLKKMGADIEVRDSRVEAQSAEPAGDLVVKSSILKGALVKKARIPSLIDELPVLMVAACFAEGKTVLQGVKELRVKETDRVRSMVENLKKMGADIRIEKAADSENIIIEGAKQLKCASVKSFGDHRTAMSMVIAGLAASGNTHIDDVSCIKKSFPGFLGILRRLIDPK